ncbi:hypothetical protein EZV62_024423 [Acer yangbiense]|uniref:Carbohydrate kinase PfkB domain-containing protein n=1 Tax=Acer yangbiense TaxID=1000413 RepID=A0A5C7GV39_9ROSI|nr:hypothetical protein EZV62_024423 [Acer yangbiense]
MIACVGFFGLAKFLVTSISNPIERHTNSIAIKGSIGYNAPGMDNETVGDDEFGYMLADILKQNNVNTSGVRYDSNARTALAFVTLELMAGSMEAYKKELEAIEAYKKELEEYNNSIAAAIDDNQQTT